MVIHFHEDEYLKQYVIIRPHWLVDSFTQLIRDFSRNDHTKGHCNIQMADNYKKAKVGCMHSLMFPLLLASLLTLSHVEEQTETAERS